MLDIYIDGASAGNPGASGIGIFIKGEGHLIKISEVIEDTNNHVAEFKALVRGLQEAKMLVAIKTTKRNAKNFFIIESPYDSLF